MVIFLLLGVLVGYAIGATLPERTNRDFDPQLDQNLPKTCPGPHDRWGIPQSFHWFKLSQYILDIPGYSRLTFTG